MRRRLMLKSSAGVSPVLPAEYQRVEYIESTGTQYIISSVQISQTLCYRIRFAITEMPSESQGIAFRSRSGVAGTSFGVCRAYLNSKLEVTPSTSTNDYILSSSDILKKLEVELTDSEAFVNQQKVGNRAQLNVIASGHIRLFASTWENNNNIYIMKSRMYECVFSDQNVVIFNGIPCYRKADGEIGLFDTVSQTFFTNAGSGTFTKGADV